MTADPAADPDGESGSATRGTVKPNRRVLVAGASGLLGRHLITQFNRRHIGVTTLSRGVGGAGRAVTWAPDHGQFPDRVAGELESGEFVAAINLAGAPIARAWTASARQEIRASRVQTTRTLAAALAAHAPDVPLITMSGIGAYGKDCGTTVLTEQSPLGDGFLAGVVRDWEAAADPLRAVGGRAVALRCGIVLSPDATAATGFDLPARCGIPTVFGGGHQYLAMVSMTDWIRTVAFVIGTRIDGPINVTLPSPATQRELVTALARAHRPGTRGRLLSVPKLTTRLPGGGFAWELFGSKRAVPTVLTGAGFKFRSPTVTDLVSDLTGRRHGSDDGVH